MKMKISNNEAMEFYYEIFLFPILEVDVMEHLEATMLWLSYQGHVVFCRLLLQKNSISKTYVERLMNLMTI